MGKKHALLVGASTFRDGRFPRLEKPAKDVASLEAVLRDPAVGAFDDVRTCLDAPSDQLRREIARLFSGRGRDDLVLLFFAGHGVKDDFGKLYLIASDTDRDLLSATAIPAGFITQEMDQSHSRRQVLLLDCCHSGALAEGVRAADSSAGALEAFTGKGSGKAIITASDSYQFAWEGGETPAGFENSLFTHFLVEGLRSGRADGNGDGVVTLDELYQYVHDRVLETTPKQTPQWKLADAAGDFEIARNPAPRAPLPDELLQAVKSPLPYVREGVVHELRRILGGSNPALAETAREALSGLAADRDRRVKAAAETVLAAARAGRLGVEETGAGPSPSPPPVPSPPVLAPAPAPAPAVRKVSPRAVVLGVVALAAVVVVVSLLSSRKESPQRTVPVPQTRERAPGGKARPVREEGVTFEFAPWPPGNGHATFELVVDGRSLGMLSNARPGATLRAGPLAPGLHQVRLANVALFRPDGVQVSHSGWCDAALAATEDRDRYGVVLSYSWTGSFFQYGCSVP
jgi:hypothetical protein